MKFTSKKVVSEVVIDFEDGCVITLTKGNIRNMTINYEYPLMGEPYYVVVIDMFNGVSFSLTSQNENLLEDLNKLIS